jgi:hypothetical protein
MILHRNMISFLFVISTFAASANAVDTTIAGNSNLQKEVLPIITKHNPRIATKRSAIIPGWGQAYNKEYWKIPIVYGALSIPTVTFFYNNTWYNRTKSAYDLVYKASDPLTATKQDTLNLQNIYPVLQGFSLGSLQTFRNAFRKDRDFSALWFLIVWGLNVVDATVFGHLKEFEVSDNLSLNIHPSINPINNSKGLSLSLSMKTKEKKLINVK